MDKYIGKVLADRYEILELIGIGGMAYVYRAMDKQEDRVVAVKILKDEFLANEEFIRRFRNESRAIALLNHPNIVKIYDVLFGEFIQMIVMEYIDGITLKEYIDHQKVLKWKEVVHFTVQILRALPVSYTHLDVYKRQSRKRASRSARRAVCPCPAKAARSNGRTRWRSRPPTGTATGFALWAPS